MAKRKLNILDAFIIVVVLAVICLFAFKFMGSDRITKAGEYKEVEYVIKVQSLRDFTAEAILKEGAIQYEEDGAAAGEIISKEVLPAEGELRLVTGETKTVTVPDRYDVYVTVKSEGVQKDNGFYLYGKTAVNIGNNKMYKCGHVVFSGTVIEINS